MPGRVRPWLYWICAALVASGGASAAWLFLTGQHELAEGPAFVAAVFGFLLIQQRLSRRSSQRVERERRPLYCELGDWLSLLGFSSTGSEVEKELRLRGRTPRTELEWLVWPDSDGDMPILLTASAALPAGTGLRLQLDLRLALPARDRVWAAFGLCYPRRADDPEFDRAFLLEGAPLDELQHLLDPGTRRALIDLLARITFRLRTEGDRLVLRLDEHAARLETLGLARDVLARVAERLSGARAAAGPDPARRAELEHLLSVRRARRGATAAASLCGVGTGIVLVLVGHGMLDERALYWAAATCLPWGLLVVPGLGLFSSAPRRRRL